MGASRTGALPLGMRQEIRVVFTGFLIITQQRGRFLRYSRESSGNRVSSHFNDTPLSAVDETT
jgi:hypothetical protein